MTWSIRARLTAWYSLVVVTVLVAGAIAVSVVQGRLGLERLDEELARLILTLEGVMRNEINEGQSLQSASTEASIEVIAPDRTIRLASTDGSQLARWGLELPPDWQPQNYLPSPHQTIVIGSTRLRLFSQFVQYRGHQYIATVFAPLGGLQREHAELLLALTTGVFVALAVAALGGWVVGRQTLRPLTDMARQAAAISAHTPSERLRAPDAADELGTFAAAFNDLLNRLGLALQAQRQFMADASHELRTPVSVVRTTAQVTLARETRSAADYRESFEIVAEQSGRLARLVDSMFLLSRAEAQGIPLVREHLYLDDVVADCARALRVLAAERSVEVVTTGDTEVAFWGDDTLLRQLAGNVIHNAIRHARHGGKVNAIVQRGADALFIRIADDGVGVKPEDRERIFQRFVRLSADSNGAGLGLPIARWIAHAHGGDVILESSDATGSCFVIRLPA